MLGLDRSGFVAMRIRRALPYSTVKVVVMRGGGEGEQFQRLEIPVKLGRQ